MTESALVQREILQQRLEGEDAELHVTVATSRFVSAVRQRYAPSSSSDSSETTASFASVGSFIRSKSYAGVPISLVPGSGRNLVHPSNRQLNSSNRLCSATARLLDLQTLLELPLAALGIRMKKQPGDTQKGTYVWPDRARVEAIEVACAARDVVPESAISARALSSEDLSWKVWDFVQPERNLLVIIHIHIKAAFSQPDPISLALQPLFDSLANAPAGPREAKFRSSVRPSCCVITRSTSELCEAAHIIPRSLDHKLVGDVMYELFGHMSPPAGSTTISPLFHRRKESYPGKPDDPRNGILLSPTLRKVTIWILRSRCYLLAPPVCYEELRAFNPPCPSASRAPKSSNDEEDLELWAEQLKHEQTVQPLACADLTDAQQCLLHLSLRKRY
ncbi:hypothetical protein OC861_001377 [Tilletia horrida]|nr:hypothetical protein OC861_001377 [Tilletia horrida]